MTPKDNTSILIDMNSKKAKPPSRILLLASVLGIVVGVIFILVQPLFGMDTLTSRHAALYQQLGGLNPIPAMLIAWIAHLAVSVAYGLISAIVVIKSKRLVTVGAFTVFFSWITTVIAPPANAIIVQLVSFHQVQTDKLPGLNFNLDEKLVLHLLFFAVITVVLYGYKIKK